jgi:hypothetical protein
MTGGDIIGRARKYVAACPPAIAGSGGHGTTFGVACALVHGFALNEVDAMMLMQEYNQACAPHWTERDLLHKIQSAARAAHSKPRGWMVDGSSDENAPVYVPAKKKEKLLYDAEILKKVQCADWTCDHAWLRARSSVDPWTVDTGDFIDAIYTPQDLVMCFTSMRSMGDYMRYKGAWFALGKDPQVKAQRVKDGPRGSREGCVMMIQPVDGKWHAVQGTTPPRLSRRTIQSVAAFRFMLWESDEAPEAMWLNAIAQVRLPIVAITSSAGRSLHALVRVDARDYDEWSAMRTAARDVMTMLGFDPQSLSNPTAAMRMPNTMREGKMKEGRFVPFEHGAKKQRLLYFNPSATINGGCIGEEAVRAW